MIIKDGYRFMIFLLVKILNFKGLIQHIGVVKDQIIHLRIDNGIQFNADIVRIKYQTYQ